MKKICVLGSLNIDMTISVPHFNLPGESLTGTGLAIYTGGKGGNQAIAAARLGADVKLIGCLGTDANGGMYRERLIAEGVDVSGVEMTEKALSGTAFIEVVPSGENRIAVAQGANDVLDAELVRRAADCIPESGLYLSQMENPPEAIEEGLRLAHARGCTVILDPAPARPVADELLALCDVITPNETELHILTGMPVETEQQAIDAARMLVARGARLILNKRGASGALLVTENEARMIPGFAVHAVDTTAAGDSFNAGLAVALAQGMEMTEAVRFANAVGALSTTRPGAQGAMPTMDAVRAFLVGR